MANTKTIIEELEKHKHRGINILDTTAEVSKCTSI